MFNRTLFLTALISSILLTGSLKFMELFSFINWSPIGWGKNTSLHFTVKWGLLSITFFIIFILLYIIMFYLHAIPPAISAIFFTVLLVFIAEWFISEAKSPMELVQSISIPLLAVTSMIMRFISGTAVFYYELSRKE